MCILCCSLVLRPAINRAQIGLTSDLSVFGLQGITTQKLDDHGESVQIHSCTQMLAPVPQPLLHFCLSIVPLNVYRQFLQSRGFGKSLGTSHPSGNCTTVLFCSQILLLFLSNQMSVSSQKVIPVTLPQLDVTFQLICMAVFGFPFNSFFFTRFPFNERVCKF